MIILASAIIISLSNTNVIDRANSKLVASLIANYGAYAGTSYGDDVIGTIGNPTVELIIAGWNERHSSSKMTLTTNSNGYMPNNQLGIVFDTEDSLYYLGAPSDKNIGVIY